MEFVVYRKFLNPLNPTLQWLPTVDGLNPETLIVFPHVCRIFQVYRRYCLFCISMSLIIQTFDEFDIYPAWGAGMFST